MAINLSRSPFSKRTGAIAGSGVLIILAFVFMVLCLAQLGGKWKVSCVVFRRPLIEWLCDCLDVAGPPLKSGAQAAVAIASILQVLLVGLASTMCVHLFSPKRANKVNLSSQAYLLRGKKTVG